MHRELIYNHCRRKITVNITCKKSVYFPIDPITFLQDKLVAEILYFSVTLDFQMDGINAFKTYHTGTWKYRKACRFGLSLVS